MLFGGMGGGGCGLFAEPEGYVFDKLQFFLPPPTPLSSDRPKIPEKCPKQSE